MNDEKDRYFSITDKNGDTKEYEILFTFDSEETKKSYIVFTNNELDDTNSIITYAATYKKSGKELVLGDIKTDKEWDLIENLLAEIEEKSEE